MWFSRPIKTVPVSRRLNRPCGSTRYVLFLLFGNDQIFDFVINRLGHYLLLHEFVLGPIGTSVNDLRRVGIANTRNGLELVGGSGVDVDESGGFLRCRP